MSDSDAYNITLAGLSDDLLFQFYCLNPPSDNCDWGPCPNPDITGLGQQVSVYVTSVILSITIVHNPTNFRTVVYPYFLNIYSLSISTFFAVFRLGITQNDFVFIILSIASPAQIYLWFISIVSLIPERFCSLRLSSVFADSMATGRHWEGKFINGLSLLSFLIWSFFLALLLAAPKQVKFTQSSCNADYGKTQLLGLLWAPFFLLSCFISFIIIQGFGKLLSFQKKRAVQELESPFETEDHDTIATLTGRNWSLATLKSPTDKVESLILLNIQVITLGAPGNIQYQNMPLGIISIIKTSLLFGYARRSQSTGGGRWSSYIRHMKLLFLIAGMCVYEVSMALSLPIPFTGFLPSEFFTGVLWVRSFVLSMRSRQLRFQRLIAYIFATVLCGILAVIFRIYIPLSQDLELDAFNVIIPLSPLLYFMWWQIETNIPQRTDYNKEDLLHQWKNRLEPLPLLNFLFFVVNPNALWISSTILSSAVISTSMSFGQIFSMTVAAFSLLSLRKYFLILYHKLNEWIKMTKDRFAAESTAAECISMKIDQEETASPRPLLSRSGTRTEIAGENNPEQITPVKITSLLRRRSSRVDISAVENLAETTRPPKSSSTRRSIKAESTATETTPEEVAPPRPSSSRSSIRAEIAAENPIGPPEIPAEETRSLSTPKSTRAETTVEENVSTRTTPSKITLREVIPPKPRSIKAEGIAAEIIPEETPVDIASPTGAKLITTTEIIPADIIPEHSGGNHSG
ncbi:hypothetical protein M422DRAFT_244796 [Sphaerobolus stellatus SS14]|nr:hypothetical protein M422DRAFT_244796 [Sphaerobolus stellatus SS14]